MLKYTLFLLLHLLFLKLKTHCILLPAQPQIKLLTGTNADVDYILCQQNWKDSLRARFWRQADKRQNIQTLQQNFIQYSFFLSDKGTMWSSKLMFNTHIGSIKWINFWPFCCPYSVILWSMRPKITIYAFINQ